MSGEAPAEMLEQPAMSLQDLEAIRQTLMRMRHFVNLGVVRGDTLEVTLTLLAEERSVVVAKVDEAVTRELQRYNLHPKICYDVVDRDVLGLANALDLAHSMRLFDGDDHVFIDEVSMAQSGQFVQVRLWCDEMQPRAVAEHILQRVKLSPALIKLMRLEVLFDDYMLTSKLRARVEGIEEVWMTRSGTLTIVKSCELRRELLLPQWLRKRSRIFTPARPLRVVAEEVSKLGFVLSFCWAVVRGELVLELRCKGDHSVQVSLEQLASDTWLQSLQKMCAPTSAEAEAPARPPPALPIAQPSPPLPSPAYGIRPEPARGSGDRPGAHTGAVGSGTDARRTHGPPALAAQTVDGRGGERGSEASDDVHRGAAGRPADHDPDAVFGDESDSSSSEGGGDGAPAVRRVGAGEQREREQQRE